MHNIFKNKQSNKLVVGVLSVSGTLFWLHAVCADVFRWSKRSLGLLRRSRLFSSPTVSYSATHAFSCFLLLSFGRLSSQVRLSLILNPSGLFYFVLRSVVCNQSVPSDP